MLPAKAPRQKLEPIAASKVPKAVRRDLARDAARMGRMVRFFATSLDVPTSALEAAAQSFPRGQMIHDYQLESGERIRIQFAPRRSQSPANSRKVIHRGIEIILQGAPRSRMARTIARAFQRQARSHAGHP